MGLKTQIRPFRQPLISKRSAPTKTILQVSQGTLQNWIIYSFFGFSDIIPNENFRHEFEIQGSGFRVLGLGFWVQGLKEFYRF